MLYRFDEKAGWWYIKKNARTFGHLHFMVIVLYGRKTASVSQTGRLFYSLRVTEKLKLLNKMTFGVGEKKDFVEIKNIKIIKKNY